MDVEHLSKSEKEILIHYLMRCYRSAKRDTAYLEDCDLIKEKIEEYRSDRKTCLLIDRALEEMDYELREVIKEEFLEKKKLQMILEKHSRSNYYRLRNQAVDDFLRCL